MATRNLHFVLFQNTSIRIGAYVQALRMFTDLVVKGIVPQEEDVGS